MAVYTSVVRPVNNAAASTSQFWWPSKTCLSCYRYKQMTLRWFGFSRRSRFRRHVVPTDSKGNTQERCAKVNALYSNSVPDRNRALVYLTVHGMTRKFPNRDAENNYWYIITEALEHKEEERQYDALARSSVHSAQVDMPLHYHAHAPDVAHALSCR